jgi:predicted nuclease of predicted toxin-antitoxin system
MLRLLIDENFDHNILRGLVRRVPQLDFLVVAQIGLAGAADIDLLRWAAQENRTIVTHDRKTMIPDAEQLLAQHEPMTGVILVPDQLPIGRAIADLELSILTQSQSDMRDRIQHLPL